MRVCIIVHLELEKIKVGTFITLDLCHSDPVGVVGLWWGVGAKFFLWHKGLVIRWLYTVGRSINFEFYPVARFIRQGLYPMQGLSLGSSILIGWVYLAFTPEQVTRSPSSRSMFLCLYSLYVLYVLYRYSLVWGGMVFRLSYREWGVIKKGNLSLMRPFW